MLSLSHLYLTTGDLDACQNQLTTLLKGDQDNESATVVRFLLFSFGLAAYSKLFKK